jgi:hypothetical protein
VAIEVFSPAREDYLPKEWLFADGAERVGYFSIDAGRGWDWEYRYLNEKGWP